MPSDESRLHSMEDQVNRLRQQIEATERQLRDLKIQLQKAEQDVEASRRGEENECDHVRCDRMHGNSKLATMTDQQSSGNGWPLRGTEYQRYGRQMIMPEIGLPGQVQLKNSKVLIVGVGGLGCPAATYLAGAGVGVIGLMDGDTVETSNLHRQIAHSTRTVGMSKVNSAYEYLHSLNPEIEYVQHQFHLSPEQAISVFEQYDLLLDCTDHPTSRYLISDACVLTGKPLVSASALKTEGQLIILNDPPRPPGDASGGPCYRCIFPKPPPAESVLSCGEGGILGPVVGTMGVLQALEAIKLLTRRSKTADEDIHDINGASVQDPPRASLLMFSAFSNPQFRTVRLRSRRPDCAVCSERAIVTKQSLLSGSLDYVAFCGRTVPINLLPPESRVSAGDFANLPRDASSVFIDVRDVTQYGICALPGFVSVPWTGSADSWLAKACQERVLDEESVPKYLVCRYGNDSQLAAKAIMDRKGSAAVVKDVKGGLEAWRTDVDSTWPEY